MPLDLPVTPPVKPMLAKSVPSVPDQPGPGAASSSGYVYEPKWDGFRAIVYRDGEDVHIGSRTGKPMERYFPDVVAAVRDALPERCVVDGEIVIAQVPADDAGARSHLNFELLSQRIHPAESRVNMLAETTPAALVVFDVLAVGDDSLMDRPLADRLEALDALGLTGPLVFATPRTRDTAVANEWFEAFEGAGLDGVIAKPLDGVYEPNKRAMVKVKHARTADVVLAGYRLHKTSTPERPLLGSLLLGLYDDDRGEGGAYLQFVGVSASFSEARRAELVTELADLVVVPGTPEADEHPWSGWADPAKALPAAEAGDRLPGAVSRWSGGKDLSFTPLRPERVLEVGYDHMEGTRFRHTTQFKRWRPDRDPESCTYEQLAEPVRFDLTELLPGAPGTAR
ncbi:ATP-dependent DNA ligase [Myceligenerans sp. TRM 65318]|uniref:DNA ligase (ATP) n=2 Tax=Myceligenerans pegani TaxID=2776917 RepID=A0ABR9N110_9MICO|nr:ATP-dependent DNA ligase [Myceligenerans sp. TRM 65318]MBE3019029.1 ATP-dependent DNA ligase [Myceligenerans sp. TRM 65318]